MPSDHGIRLYDNKSLLPSWPQPDERNPEGSIERRQPRPSMATCVDLELLAQRELDERLILSTSKECKKAAEDRERESGSGLHGRRC
jgi:hypothetical protein